MEVKLKFIIFSIQIVFAISDKSGSKDSIIARDYIWHNSKDFLNYGWTEETANTTRVYTTPTEMDVRLYALSRDITGEVWGWKRPDSSRTSVKYVIDLGTKPEYCGIINATISFKYYLEGGQTSTSDRSNVYPACPDTSSYQCYISDSEKGKWSRMTEPVRLSRTKRLEINIKLLSTGLFLLDEVRLTYAVSQNESDCPYSCNHDCDYRGLDCHNYYTCIDRRYKEFHKCNKSDGLAFNPVTKSCDLIDKVETCREHPPPRRCVCEFRPYRYDCSLYFYCPDTCHPELCESRKCPNGLLWSMDAKGDGSRHQQCVPPSSAFCFGVNDTLTTEYTSSEPPTTMWSADDIDELLQ